MKMREGPIEAINDGLVPHLHQTSLARTGGLFHD